MPLFESVNSQVLSSRKLRARLLDEIHRLAGACARARGETGGITKSTGALESQNPELAALNQYAIAGYFVLLANCIAAYIIDCILFSSAVEYFAQLGFHDSPNLVTVARFIVPLAVILIEIHVGLQLSSAVEEAAEDDSTPARYWFWLVRAGSRFGDARRRYRNSPHCHFRHRR